MYQSSKTQAVMNDMRYSLKQVEKARPIIRDLLGGGEIKAVEGRDDEICLMLDQNCGTDYFQKYKNGVVFGIGSRFQSIAPGQPLYNTFTIRKARESGAPTEYEKRKLAIEKNGIYPYWTMHGYYSSVTGDILSLAIARTEDIWQDIADGYTETNHTGIGKIGQAEFYVVRWNEFKNRHLIRIYQK